MSVAHFESNTLEHLFANLSKHTRLDATICNNWTPNVVGLQNVRVTR